MTSATATTSTTTTTTTTTTTSTGAASTPWHRIWTDQALAFWDTMSPGWQFFWLTMSVFLFFGSHNLLQEALMQILERRHGVMLGYLEVLGVTVCTALEALSVAEFPGPYTL